MRPLPWSNRNVVRMTDYDITRHFRDYKLYIKPLNRRFSEAVRLAVIPGSLSRVCTARERRNKSGCFHPGRVFIRGPEYFSHLSCLT